MPQLMPLNWMISFLMVSFVFFMMVFMYFNLSEYVVVCDNDDWVSWNFKWWW